MDRPTWATVVGILAIVFGSLGILGAGQAVIMPKMMTLQKEFFTEFERAAKQEEVQSDPETQGNMQENMSGNKEFEKEMFGSMKKMLELPEWFGLWAVFAGIAKGLISVVYLLAGIFLLKTKTFSIRLFYWAAGSSLLLCVISGVVGISASSFMAISMVFGSAFGAVIDIVLIIVVVTGDKEAFQRLRPPPIQSALMVMDFSIGCGPDSN